MVGGFVPRFLAEIAFLSLLALAAGLAELDTPYIAALMAVGWVLVTLIEWLAWRSERGARAEPKPPSARGEPGPEESTSWDIQEILAPLPEAEDGAPEAGARP